MMQLVRTLSMVPQKKEETRGLSVQKGSRGIFEAFLP